MSSGFQPFSLAYLLYRQLKLVYPLCSVNIIFNNGRQEQWYSTWDPYQSYVPGTCSTILNTRGPPDEYYLYSSGSMTRKRLKTTSIEEHVSLVENYRSRRARSSIQVTPRTVFTATYKIEN